MSVQEKRIIANMVSSALIFVIYGFIIWGRYMEATLDVTETLRFWAIAILIFIPISIVARIIIMIIFAIIENIAAEIQGKEVEDFDIVDERDKLIESRSNTISLVIFAIGFIISLGTLAFELPPTTFFVTMVLFGFFSDIASEVRKLVYYRRGL